MLFLLCKINRQCKGYTKRYYGPYCCGTARKREAWASPSYIDQKGIRRDYANDGLAQWPACDSSNVSFLNASCSGTSARNYFRLILDSKKLCVPES